MHFEERGGTIIKLCNVPPFIAFFHSHPVIVAHVLGESREHWPQLLELFDSPQVRVGLATPLNVGCVVHQEINYGMT